MVKESFKDTPKSKKSVKKSVKNELDTTAGYDTWNSTQLAKHFAKKGLADYQEVLAKHRIDGKIAPLLTDGDLKDMGINIVGDRCRFRCEIDALKRKERADLRTKVIWKGKEKLFYGCLDAGVGTCCGICPTDPSTYTLTASHLKVKQVEKKRVLCFECCCFTTVKINNIDLSNVDDVDMVSTPAPFMIQLATCCMCVSGTDTLDVSTTNEGNIALYLKEGSGISATELILNQVEEAQLMERD